MRKTFLFLALVLGITATSWADTSYFRTLVDRPVATFGDACHMIANFLGERADQPNFPTQKSALESRGLLAPSLAAKAESDILRRGELADLVVRALEIDEGLVLGISGFSRNSRWGQYVFRRYAFREAVYRNIVERGNINTAVTGEELIGVISRMGEYK